MSGELKEDYLNRDPSIPGQKYVLLSFVSPEKILEDKLKEFENMKQQVNFIAGQITLLQELTTCKCEEDCECKSTG